MYKFYNKSFIRRKIDYESVIYNATAKNNKYKLVKIQHHALCITAGTPTTTSIEALELWLYRIFISVYE